MNERTHSERGEDKKEKTKKKNNNSQVQQAGTIQHNINNNNNNNNKTDEQRQQQQNRTSRHKLNFFLNFFFRSLQKANRTQIAHKMDADDEDDCIFLLMETIRHECVSVCDGIVAICVLLELGLLDDSLG